MQRPLFIFILASCAAQNLIGQSKISIRQIGTKSNLMDSLVVNRYENIKPERVNDSTIEFAFHLSQPENIFIIIDFKTEWITTVWMDPKIKRKEIIIDYSKKTETLLNPNHWDVILQKIISLEEEYKGSVADSVALAYIEQHPDSFASVWLLSHTTEMEAQKKSALFNKLNPALSKYKEYQQIKADLTHRKYPLLGDPFKEFVLTNINDSVFNTNTINNKWIFLHFWAIFCSPCVREMDGLVSFYNTLDTSKISFVSVALDDDRTKWKNSKTTHKIKWANIWQTDNFYGELCLNYNVDMVPFFIIFNKEKKIHLITFGEELELVKSTLLSVQ